MKRRGKSQDPHLLLEISKRNVDDWRAKAGNHGEGSQPGTGPTGEAIAEGDDPVEEVFTELDCCVDLTSCINIGT